MKTLLASLLNARATWLLALGGIGVYAACLQSPHAAAALAFKSGAGLQWQAITYMFVNLSPVQLAANTAVLIAAGAWMERGRHWWQLVLTFIVSGLGGAAFYAMAGVPGLLAGASASVYGILTAALLGAKFKKNGFAVKAAGFATLLLSLLLTAPFNPGGTVAHLGGIACGTIIALMPARKPAKTSTAEVRMAMQSGFSSLSAAQRQALTSNNRQR